MSYFQTPLRKLHDRRGEKKNLLNKNPCRSGKENYFLFLSKLLYLEIKKSSIPLKYNYYFNFSMHLNYRLLCIYTTA